MDQRLRERGHGNLTLFIAAEAEGAAAVLDAMRQVAIANSSCSDKLQKARRSESEEGARITLVLLLADAASTQEEGARVRPEVATTYHVRSGVTPPIAGDNNTNSLRLADVASPAALLRDSRAMQYLWHRLLAMSGNLAIALQDEQSSELRSWTGRGDEECAQKLTLRRLLRTQLSLGRSHEEFAQDLGLSRSTYLYWLHGNSPQSPPLPLDLPLGMAISAASQRRVCDTFPLKAGGSERLKGTLGVPVGWDLSHKVRALTSYRLRDLAFLRLFFGSPGRPLSKSAFQQTISRSERRASAGGAEWRHLLAEDPREDLGSKGEVRLHLQASTAARVARLWQMAADLSVLWAHAPRRLSSTCAPSDTHLEAKKIYDDIRNHGIAAFVPGRLVDFQSDIDIAEYFANYYLSGRLYAGGKGQLLAANFPAREPILEAWYRNPTLDSIDRESPDYLRSHPDAFFRWLQTEGCRAIDARAPWLRMTTGDYGDLCCAACRAETLAASAP